MSDTPRVSDEIFLLGSQHASNITPEGRTGPAVVMADFARQLERELSEANARIEKLEGALRNPTNETLAAMMDTWNNAFGSPYTRYVAMLNVAVDAAIKEKS